MAFARVAGVSAGSTDLNTVTTAAIDTTGAKLIVLAVACSGYTLTVSDSKSNTWVQLTERVQGANHLRLFYVVNPTVGSGHTFTTTQANSAPALSVTAFSGDIASTDQENGAGGASVSTLATGSITPSKSNAVVVAAVNSYDTNPSSIDGGFTTDGLVNNVGGQHVGVGLAYLIQTSVAAANPTWAMSGTASVATAAIASFILEPLTGQMFAVL